MIKESKSEFVLMFGSFIFGFFIIAGILYFAFQGKTGIGSFLVLLAWFALAMHGRSSAMLVEKDAIGKAISYQDIKDETPFKIIQEIGAGYYKVAPAAWDEKTAQTCSRIVKDLPPEVAFAGCVFFKKRSEVFIKPSVARPIEQNR
jgi:hypothetical protein